MVDVAIVGGGLAGLAAAWYAQQRGLGYVLLESDSQLGGKAQSEQVWGYGDSPFTVEFGPDGFITRKPWAFTLAQEVSAETTPIRHLPKRIYVLSSGKLHPMPEGLYLLVPTQLRPFLQSSLFSGWGKIRMLAEPLIPARTSDKDESVADFIRRRFGAEALDKLGEPLLAGVYGASAEHLSMGATFKQFPALEKQYGSLIRGMRQKMQAREKSADTPPALVSMLNGMGDLPTAIAKCLHGDIRLDTPVQQIEKHNGGFTLTTENETITASSVVATTPATVTASLLESVAPQAAEHLHQIRYEGVGSAALAYRAEDIPHPMDAYGIVIPGNEGRKIDGITFASTKWANRAPAGHHLLRVFFGGPNTSDMIDKTDEELIHAIQAELSDLLGITAEPLFYRIRKWEAGYPQYDVGHEALVGSINQSLPQNVFVAGLSYYGVGIPDTVHGAKTAIEKITVT